MTTMSAPPRSADPRPWLQHIDRRALPTWMTLAAAQRPRLEDEVGEGFRIAWMTPDPAEEPDAAMAAFLRDGLVRWRMPILARWPRARLVGPAADDAALDTEIAALARVHDIGATVVFPIRRYGRGLAAQLRARLAARFAWDAPATPETPCLTAAVSDHEVLVGVVAPRATGAAQPGGLPPHAGAVAAGPSRARHKLVEALDWLATADASVADCWTSWLELGAFPGGMTSELARRGWRVVAVDLAAPSAALQALSGVVYVRTDGLAYRPSAPFDAVLCDMNGPPMRTARAVARLGAALPADGLVILTVKLPSWSDWPRVGAAVRAQLVAAGLPSPTAHHLFSNRQEVTVIGRRPPPASVARHPDPDVGATEPASHAGSVARPTPEFIRADLELAKHGALN